MKRPFFELGDFLILIGAVMFLVGMYLLDWRLALVGGGVLLMVAGAARLGGGQ